VFGVGVPEIAVLLVVAVVVFGPDRLPDMARQAARMLHTLRGFARNAQNELRDELGPEYADLQLRDLDPRTIVKKHIMEAMNEPDEPRPRARSARPLGNDEAPPYDLDAT
jgi:sec-independent protein translocase protein TatB